MVSYGEFKTAVIKNWPQEEFNRQKLISAFENSNYKGARPRNVTSTAVLFSLRQDLSNACDGLEDVVIEPWRERIANSLNVLPNNLSREQAKRNQLLRMYQGQYNVTWTEERTAVNLGKNEASTKSLYYCLVQVGDDEGLVVEHSLGIRPPKEPYETGGVESLLRKVKESKLEFLDIIFPKKKVYFAFVVFPEDIRGNPKDKQPLEVGGCLLLPAQLSRDSMSKFINKNNHRLMRKT